MYRQEQHQDTIDPDQRKGAELIAQRQPHGMQRQDLEYRHGLFSVRLFAVRGGTHCGDHRQKAFRFGQLETASADRQPRPRPVAGRLGQKQQIHAHTQGIDQPDHAGCLQARQPEIRHCAKHRHDHGNTRMQDQLCGVAAVQHYLRGHARCCQHRHQPKASLVDTKNTCNHCRRKPCRQQPTAGHQKNSCGPAILPHQKRCPCQMQHNQKQGCVHHFLADLPAPDLMPDEARELHPAQQKAGQLAQRKF